MVRYRFGSAFGELQHYHEAVGAGNRRRGGLPAALAPVRRLAARREGAGHRGRCGGAGAGAFRTIAPRSRSDPSLDGAL